MEVAMKKALITVALVVAVGFVPVLAQENKDMPMKGPMMMNEGTSFKYETHYGMDMEKMAEMHKRMASMMEMMKMMGDTSVGTHGTKETK